MTPGALQQAVLDGYARFYSPRQWLRCLVERRWLSLRDHTWCWWYARRWARNQHNPEYLRALARMPAPASVPVPARAPSAVG